MKKLMIALAAAATTMFSFGDLPTGTSFEALTEGPVDVGGVVNKDDSGDPSGSEFYWYSTAPATDELGAITNDVAGQSVSRPDLFANQNQANTKSLQIDTTAPLVRTALPNAGASSVTGVDIGSDGIYLDTLVKFTAADEAFAEDLTGGDKIAIEYVEHEAEEGDEGYTNFVIRAGFVGGQEIVQTNYVAAVPAGFNKDEWHRLTVRTIADVGDGNVGFVIYLDGNMTKTLEYSTDVDAGFGTLNALAQTFYNSGKHALFPSAVAAEDIGGSTISSVAFSGNGFIDDVSFTATKPSFIQESSVVTVTWDEHVATLTLNGESVAGFSAGTAGSVDINPDKGAVLVDVTFASGWEAGTFTTDKNGSWDSATSSFVDLASGEICNIVSMFPYFEVNGVKYDKISDAVAAALKSGDTYGTLKLVANYTADAMHSDIELSDGGNIIIDLAGKTITGTEYGINNGAANLIITNSTAEIGHVTGGSGAVIIGGGTTTIYGGSFDAAIVIDSESFGLTLFGGKFLNCPEEIGDTNFYLNSFVDGSVTATAIENNYFQVGGGAQPIGTYQVTVTPTANATYTAAYKSDNTAITPDNDVLTVTVGQTIVITATPNSGYEYAEEPTGWTLSEGVITIEVSEAGTVAIPGPTVQTLGTYTVTVIPTNNTTYAAAYKVGGSAITPDNDVLTVTVGQTIVITATPAANYEYATPPTGWTAGQDGEITIEVSEAGTVAIPGPTEKGGKTYPSYIDDTEKTKYDTWAAYAEISAADFPDASGSNEEAYLLNCKPSEVADAKAAFKFTSISYDTTQSKWVTATTTSYNERGYNGEVVVKQYSDVGCKTESSTGTFFKAFLQ